jgi:polysaccharide biosynthesis/export protein
MTRIWLLSVSLLLIVSACVPNRKLVYVQKDDLKDRESIPKDTVLRSYPLKITEYRIQPQDIVSVQFETVSDENDEFDFLDKLSPQTRSSGSATNAAVNGIVVNTQGEIEYPVLGKIKVGGLTLFQAQDTIRAAAEKYVPNVIARVRMLNFRFTVLGEVTREQTVISTNTRLTLMEAIGQAGGLGELADRSHIKVIRQKGDSSEVYYMDLLQEELLASPHYFVQQNDVIVVPPLKQRPFRRYFVNNLAVFASTLSLIILIVSLSR